MYSEIEIIRLFSRDLSREITIRQVSKAIKKSYCYTNTEVWKLIKKGILNKKEIGKSVVCMLNLKNELTKSLLVFNSSIEKQASKKPIETGLISQLKERNAFAFYNKNSLYIVCDDKFDSDVLTKQEFRSKIKEIGLDNLVIYGFEKYWELMGDIYA